LLALDESGPCACLPGKRVGSSGHGAGPACPGRDGPLYMGEGRQYEDGIEECGVEGALVFWFFVILVIYCFFLLLFFWAGSWVGLSFFLSCGLRRLQRRRRRPLDAAGAVPALLAGPAWPRCPGSAAHRRLLLALEKSGPCISACLGESKWSWGRSCLPWRRVACALGPTCCLFIGRLAVRGS
jgi:hypothetical protein